MSATASSDGAIRLMPPSIETSLAVDVDASSTIPPTATIVGVFVAPTGDVDGRLGVDRSQLDGHGFTGTVGTTLLITSTDGTPGAAIGLGDPGSVTASSLRDAAASFARAAGKRVDLAIVAPTTAGVAPAEVAQALVEGVLLARYTLRCAPHRATWHTGARRDRRRRRRRRRRCSHRRPAGPGVRRGHQVVARPGQFAAQPLDRLDARRAGRADRPDTGVVGRGVRQGRTDRDGMRWAARGQRRQRRATPHDQDDVPARRASRPAGWRSSGRR